MNVCLFEQPVPITELFERPLIVFTPHVLKMHENQLLNVNGKDFYLILEEDVYAKLPSREFKRYVDQLSSLASKGLDFYFSIYGFDGVNASFVFGCNFEGFRKASLKFCEKYPIFFYAYAMMFNGEVLFESGFESYSKLEELSRFMLLSYIPLASKNIPLNFDKGKIVEVEKGSISFSKPFKLDVAYNRKNFVIVKNSLKGVNINDVPFVLLFRKLQQFSHLPIFMLSADLPSFKYIFVKRNGFEVKWILVKSNNLLLLSPYILNYSVV